MAILSAMNNVGAINLIRFDNPASNSTCIASWVLVSFTVTPVFLFLADVTLLFWALFNPK